MHRFIVREGLAAGAQVQLSQEEAAHAFKVLRLRPGEEVELTDGEGRLFGAKLNEVSRELVTAEVLEELDGKEAPVRITLYQGYPKADKLELIVQKLTELGACRIVPVVMERSVAKPDQKDKGKRRERLQRIAQEAAKQCGRGMVPEVEEAIVWKQALKRFSEHELMLMPWEDARDVRLKDVYEKEPAAKDVAFVIGPEGGISEREAEEAREAGALCVTLGPRILRTETAALTSTAVAMTLWGDI
ncbi:MAG: 16S rRNA (uracil(1498)-N(3))-methyltransferase [Clostridia bacterium]|nr:16S rRNA (uracil(1498)-N(3))-methyltransferase [Clostridia bacterium]